MKNPEQLGPKDFIKTIKDPVLEDEIILYLTSKMPHDVAKAFGDYQHHSFYQDEGWEQITTSAAQLFEEKIGFPIEELIEAKERLEQEAEIE